ncbi:sensor histidine kinase [Clostridium kluyveri]|uniref:Histidine kinase n=1 Tax=Clostridium kluyveri TaxID=1534 RepID=A0A1L5F3U8_CLOKL|nr:GHKL domain-containing protein [Clostridium kluyveri]APM37674.1 histidine kinase [Clostridium kluyveri]
MNNYELFFSSFTELISILILFNAFNKNSQNKFIKSFIIILLSSIVAVITNSFTSWIGTLINFAFLVFMLMFFYKKNMRDLVIEYTFIIVFVMVMELIVDRTLTVFVFGELNSEFLNYIFTNTIMIILCICIYFWVIDKIIFNMYKRINKLYFLLINFIIYGVVAKLIWESDKYIILENAFAFIMIPIVMCIVNLIFIVYSENIVEHKKSLETYNKYNSVILDLIDEIKSRQHDFKNHFSTIYGMVLTYDEKELRYELKNYLESLQKSLSDTEEYIYMGSKVFAAVIYVKVREAKQKNIDFCFNIEDNTIKFPLRGYELSEVLNNLIDNAFQAVMNMKTDKKNVYLRIMQNDKEKCIEVGNTKPEMFEKVIPNIFYKGFTTKKEDGHGYGLYNVKKIVQKYKGKIEVLIEDENVIFRITFYSI